MGARLNSPGTQTNGVMMPGLYHPSEEDFDVKTDDFVVECIAKERNYHHFDLPLGDSARCKIIDFSDEIEPHRFWPLLGYTDLSRKFVRDANGARVQKIKERLIRFASHNDAAYLQAYSEYLGKMYEAALRHDQISGSVLAYISGGGSNITHAKSLFDEIAHRESCTVFALDISGFFDHLNHQHLKSEISRLFGVARLTGHHWTVFRNMTRYSWVEIVDLDNHLGKRRSRNGRICSPGDYKSVVHSRSGSLVRTHCGMCGIPQGTPVSGLYANIYLRSFDKIMVRLVARCGGSYRRYSDDIAIVLPPGSDEKRVIEKVSKLLGRYFLNLSIAKTEIANFRAGNLVGRKPIQYLGFTYDGSETLIRPSSLDAYRTKMHQGIKAKLVAAKKKSIPSGEVFKRELLSRFTHKGLRRNFIQYAYRAAEIHSAPEIKHQVREHIKWFNDSWKREISNIYGK